MTCLRERTFPNGLLEIIVHLGERYSVVEERGHMGVSDDVRHRAAVAAPGCRGAGLPDQGAGRAA